MPTYRIEMPDGKVYQVDSDTPLSDEQAIQAIGQSVHPAAMSAPSMPPAALLSDRGPIKPGNIDLVAQPRVKRSDGTTSTVDSRSFGIDGVEVLLPSVTSGGRYLETDEEVLAEYKHTGRHLGVFSDPETATRFAQQLHEDYAAGRYDQPAGLLGRVPPVAPERGRLGKAFDFATTSVIPHETLEKEIGKVDQPSLTRGPGMARARGFVAGGLHGAADVLLSPLGLAGGAGRLLKGAGQATRAAKTATTLRSPFQATSGTGIPARWPPQTASTRPTTLQTPGGAMRTNRVPPGNPLADLTHPINAPYAVPKPPTPPPVATPPPVSPPVPRGATMGVYGPAKNILLPELTTPELLTKLAQQTVPGSRITRINKMPRPKGEGLTERAVRQRGHIDDKYTRLKGDETGELTLGALKDISQSLGKTALQARSAAMLSGLAFPKSILGNMGALATAAATGKAPAGRIYKELLSPENRNILRQAWKEVANPAQTGGVGGINVIGRAMGALDQTTQQILERAGMATKEARKLLLTNPNLISRQLERLDPQGFFYPFRRTPSNFFVGGFEEGKHALAHPLTREGLFTLGSGAAGVAAGTQSDSPKTHSLPAAFLGRRGLPYLFGAVLGSGSANVMRGASPIPELPVPVDLQSARRFTGIGAPSAARVFPWDRPTTDRPTKTRRRRPAREKREGA